MYMERKESRGRRGASWELPQQSGPIAAELWDVSGSPEPSGGIAEYHQHNSGNACHVVS